MNENINKEITVLGTLEIEGMKFHNIEGGFGEHKKAMLVKDIAEIHNRELKHINELINNNIKRFKTNIDIIDLKVSRSERLGDLKANPSKGLGCEDVGYSKQSFNQSRNIYLLSERGYSKLLKILEDDIAWEQYEKIVDGYFSMRKELNNPLLSASKELQAIFMLDKKQEVLETKIENVNEKLENFMDDAPLFNIECESIVKEVKRVATKSLGEHGSKAYKNKSLRGKVYSDIYHQIKREFGVDSYKAIKRCQLDKVLEIVNNYKLPIVFEEEIRLLNSQLSIVS
ncbi:ORF6C domain-containing protein [Clostridioides difficile]|nr:ORF6C domain-containing protein [Clostridioides difficile]MBY2543955.1 ORF6C domain-containing protein [Clostridioides difficile]MBY2706205.1 ORF6C domain-containing protein [Clostridioides difficile]MBZ1151545.1 ORF6C domain-containing protein [Clostridioides difficile]MCH7239536.1 ORF6C domain-containing protein [Clostridioides difficile]